MKASQTQWEIASTPSFVVNNKTTISGAVSFEEFDKRVRKALADNSETEAEGPCSSASWSSSARLRINGFKSFVDRTELDIGSRA
ncbi:MAG: hypothetical protein R3D66_02365 [Alphaproteobacteria bacterium]